VKPGHLAGYYIISLLVWLEVIGERELREVRCGRLKFIVCLMDMQV
jgi:hypothetical protein